MAPNTTMAPAAARIRRSRRRRGAARRLVDLRMGGLPLLLLLAAKATGGRRSNYRQTCRRWRAGEGSAESAGNNVISVPQPFRYPSSPARRRFLTAARAGTKTVRGGAPDGNSQGKLERFLGAN